MNYKWHIMLPRHSITLLMNPSVDKTKSNRSFKMISNMRTLVPIANSFQDKCLNYFLFTSLYIERILTRYTWEPAILKNLIVISGAEKLHVHVMILILVDSGFTTLEASSPSTIFFFFDEWRTNQGCNRLIMMLHCVPPSLISVSALTGEMGWRKGSK